MKFSCRPEAPSYFCEPVPELIAALSRPGAWQSIVSIHAISAVLGLPVHAYYPAVEGPFIHEFTRTIYGRGLTKRQQNLPANHIIMFSSMLPQADNQKFNFNHFVPLIQLPTRVRNCLYSSDVINLYRVNINCQIA